MRAPILAPLLALLTLASPARADFPETVQDHILPGYADFETATKALAEAAANTCAPADLTRA